MVPASQLHPSSPTPLPEVIGGLTRDESAAVGSKIPIVQGGCSASSRTEICAEPARHSADTWKTLTAADLMTADPITVDADVLVVKALEQMEHNRRKPISVLPVVNQKSQLMGLLRLHDLVQAGLA